MPVIGARAPPPVALPMPSCRYRVSSSPTCRPSLAAAFSVTSTASSSNATGLWPTRSRNVITSVNADASCGTMTCTDNGSVSSVPATCMFCTSTRVSSVASCSRSMRRADSRSPSVAFASKLTTVL